MNQVEHIYTLYIYMYGVGAHSKAAVAEGGLLILPELRHYSGHLHDRLLVHLSEHSYFIAASIQFEYDLDEVAKKIATQLVPKSNTKTDV